MTTALASLLSGRPVKHTVGMTGEVTLQGRVLPIGGLKQKVLAAHAAGLTDVIIPERNRAGFEDELADSRVQRRIRVEEQPLPANRAGQKHPDGEEKVKEVRQRGLSQTAQQRHHNGKIGRSRYGL